MVIDRLTPRIPPNFPAGDYQLSLRLLDANDDTLFTQDLGPVRVNATERLFQAPKVRFPQNATFGDEIKLLGYELQATETDGIIRLQLVWQALRPPTADYTVFVHLLARDGSCCLWQQDVMPKQNLYPTSRWVTDEIIVDSYDIVLPEDLAPGDYPLEVGLYLAENGRRLQVTIPGLPTSDAVQLWPLPVE